MNTFDMYIYVAETCVWLRVPLVYIDFKNELYFMTL